MEDTIKKIQFGDEVGLGVLTAGQIEGMKKILAGYALDVMHDRRLQQEAQAVIQTQQ